MPVGPDGYFPVRVVNQPVMKSAQQYQVVQVCAAAVYPMFDVVGMRPRRWCTAVRECAPAIACNKRSTLPCRGGTRGTAQIDGDTVLVENHRR